MRVQINRGSVVIAALLVGLVIGLFAGAYIFYAIMPADQVFKNASPKFLNSDPVSFTPQYRDFYVVRAADRYQHDLQAGIQDPLRGSYDVLGVTTGDTTMSEAIAMVRASEKVANKENNADGDSGVFTKNEELAMGSLADALDKASQSGTYPKVDLSKYAPLQNKTVIRVGGAVLFILLLGVGGGLLWYMDRRTRTGESVSQTTSIFSRVSEPLAYHEPAFSPAPTTATSPGISTAHNATVNLSPTSPGTASTMFAPPASRLTTPIMSGDSPIATFAPTIYRHGDDHYDEDFAINGSLGELIGECGASIADRIGLDTPSRVSALSLWVFDKNDFQSTTKVLMSDYAWNDSVSRSKLRARGEAVQAMDGGVVEILTSTLRVEVQVSEMTYNSDKNPERGYFQSITLTFRVFRRQTAV